MIDAHAHLTDPDLLAQIVSVIARMTEHGVCGALVVGTDLPSSREAVALAAREPAVLRATIGVHPHESSTLDAEGLAELRALCAHPAVVAVGEIGLDYHYDFSPRDVQRDALRRQLALAAEVGLPIVLHEREAADDLCDILDAEGGWLRGGAWHCCSVEPNRAVHIAQHLYIGIAGWVTFPKAENIRDIVRAVPLERLLLETDSPYLAPVPRRGKRNDPSNLPLVAAAVGALRELPATRVGEITQANTFRAFPRWQTTGSAATGNAANPGRRPAEGGQHDG